MAFDGITISNIVHDLNNTILGGRLYKIAQPESDELLLTIKTGSGRFKGNFIFKCITAACIYNR